MPDLNYARILWNNLARSGIVSASGEVSGFPAKAAQNDNTFEFWQPPSVPAWWRVNLGSVQVVSGMGIAAHNLKTVGASVKVQYSYDDSNWLDASDEHPPHNDDSCLLIFTPQSAQYWRAYFTGAPPTVGVLSFGPVLSMQDAIVDDHSPITLSRENELIPSISEKGQWLGATVIRSGLNGAAKWRNLTAEWYREHFDPFVVSTRSRAKPFFFAWNPAISDDDIAYCMMDRDVRPVFKIAGLVDVDITFIGMNRVS